METQGRAGQVISFYSFKGGTGRTMALANVACLLSTQNKGRVLMIDWDLEAPGLHFFFNRKLQSHFKDAGGLIDLFVELDDASVLKSEPETTEPARALLDRVEPERFIISTEVPRLDLMKAGRFDADYPTRVATFRWEQLFLRVPTLMRCFVERLAATYRYVLVDSRTGNSDTGGICTTLLPEKLVAVFTPSAQSLTGLLDIIRRAVGYRRQLSLSNRPIADAGTAPESPWLQAPSDKMSAVHIGGRTPPPYRYSQRWLQPERAPTEFQVLDPHQCRPLED